MPLSKIHKPQLRTTSHISSSLDPEVFKSLSLKKIKVDEELILSIQTEFTTNITIAFTVFLLDEFRAIYGEQIQSVPDLYLAIQDLNLISSLDGQDLEESGELYNLKIKLFAYLYAIVGLSNKLVSILLKKQSDKLKLKSWDHSTINAILLNLSNYSFDPKVLGAISYQIEDVLSNFPFLNFTETDLKLARSKFDFETIKTELEDFTPGLLAVLNKILRGQCFKVGLNPEIARAMILFESDLGSAVFPSLNQSLDYGVDMHLLRKKLEEKQNIDELDHTYLNLFEEVDFKFVKFIPVRKVKVMVQKVHEEVSNVEIPEVTPSAKPKKASSSAEFYYIFDQLQVLSENIPHFYPLYEVSYFEVLPSKEEVMADFGFLQNISSGTIPFVPKTDDIECPVELQGLSDTEVKAKIISISKELKKHYKEFTSHYF